jgi:hypothetical protein
VHALLSAQTLEVRQARKDVKILYFEKQNITGVNEIKADYDLRYKIYSQEMVKMEKKIVKIDEYTFNYLPVDVC